MVTSKKSRKKRKKRQVLNTYRENDRRGNVFIAEHTKDEIHLYLYIKTEDRKRYIGKINKENRVLYIRRDRMKHYHYESKGYGYNYKLFKHSTRFDTVHLTDEFSSFEFPRTLVTKQATVMNFIDSDDGNDYELQYFLPIKIMNEYDIGGDF
jgi:hypothetical protein